MKCLAHCHLLLLDNTDDDQVQIPSSLWHSRLSAIWPLTYSLPRAHYSGLASHMIARRADIPPRIPPARLSLSCCFYGHSLLPFLLPLRSHAQPSFGEPIPGLFLDSCPESLCGSGPYFSFPVTFLQLLMVLSTAHHCYWNKCWLPGWGPASPLCPSLHPSLQGWLPGIQLCGQD